MLPDGFTVMYKCNKTLVNINLSLTEHKGSTGEYWPEVVGTRSVQKRPWANIPPVRLELARLVSSLLYGTRARLVFNFLAFKTKKCTADDRFHGNGPYGKILTKKEPIRTLRFTLPYNNIHYYIPHK